MSDNFCDRFCKLRERETRNIEKSREYASVFILIYSCCCILIGEEESFSFVVVPVDYCWFLQEGNGLLIIVNSSRNIKLIRNWSTISAQSMGHGVQVHCY